jgi:hypothetical protein
MKEKLILAFLALTLTISLASATTYTFGSNWDNSNTFQHSSNPIEFNQGPKYTYSPTITNKVSSLDSTNHQYTKIIKDPSLEVLKSYQQTYVEGKHGRVSAGIKATEVQRLTGGYSIETNNGNTIQYFSQDYSYSSPNPTSYDAGYNYKQNPSFDYFSSASAGSFTGPSHFTPRRMYDGSFNWRY